jgi:hypothetical protein
MGRRNLARRIMPALGAAFGLCLLASAGPAAGAAARPATTWQAICDQETTALCAYVDGTNGDFVYGHTFASGTNAEDSNWQFIVGPCGSSTPADGSDADDGNCNGTVWWPSSDHSLDTSFDQAAVVQVQNVHYGNCYTGTTSNGDVKQAGCGSTGYLWFITSVPGCACSHLVNVLVSQDFQAEYRLCETGTDNPLVTRFWSDCNGVGGQWSRQS